LKCRRGAPALVTSGFVLAVDDCAKPASMRSGNYGQCSNLEVRDESGWWAKHTQSLAAKLVSTYERGGAGWCFAAWKLSAAQASALGPYATSAWSLQAAAAAGHFPVLPASSEASTPWQEPAAGCLVPTAADFAMGDATYAPSAEPVPYQWVPPPGWQVPTPMPTNCPELLAAAATESASASGSGSASGSLLVSAVAGLVCGFGLAAVALAFALHKGSLQAPTRRGYTPVTGQRSAVELPPYARAQATRASSVQVQV
jgi:hypothetical protein